MRRQDFHYDLPQELIAQQPAPDRSASRLLHVDADAGVFADRSFSDVVDLLAPGDLLVLNDTRVIPARLFGRKETGGRIEILMERIVDPRRALAQIRASRSPEPGAVLELEGGARLRVRSRADGLFELEQESGRAWPELLEAHGHMPLPPYIERADAEADRDRYQTVFARRPGAVAAPTAGLHFDLTLLETLTARGVETAFMTLHVGAGTFQPVRADRIEDHRMHSEYVDVSASVCERIRATRAAGGRVVAVGTTVVRGLETAARANGIEPFQGETDIFITPGYRFRTVDAMLTNFHLPESTLLMLVCAFAGRELILRAYRHAIEQRYRFYSYGDAMFITK